MNGSAGATLNFFAYFADRRRLRSRCCVVSQFAHGRDQFPQCRCRSRIDIASRDREIRESAAMDGVNTTHERVGTPVEW
jgi:hypothetical protein